MNSCMAWLEAQVPCCLLLLLLPRRFMHQNCSKRTIKFHSSHQSSLSLSEESVWDRISAKTRGHPGHPFGSRFWGGTGVTEAGLVLAEILGGHKDFSRLNSLWRLAEFGLWLRISARSKHP